MKNLGIGVDGFDGKVKVLGLEGGRAVQERVGPGGSGRGVRRHWGLI